MTVGASPRSVGSGTGSTGRRRSVAAGGGPGPGPGPGAGATAAEEDPVAARRTSTIEEKIDEDVLEESVTSEVVTFANPHTRLFDRATELSGVTAMRLAEVDDSNLGNEIGDYFLHKLAETFYTRAQADPDPAFRLMFADRAVFPLAQNLGEFVTQRFGGHTFYGTRRGNMSLVGRHAHLTITADKAEKWLKHMDALIDELFLKNEISALHRALLLDYFAWTAYYLVAAQVRVYVYMSPTRPSFFLAFHLLGYRPPPLRYGPGSRPRRVLQGHRGRGGTGPQAQRAGGGLVVRWLVVHRQLVQRIPRVIPLPSSELSPSVSLSLCMVHTW